MWVLALQESWYVNVIVINSVVLMCGITVRYFVFVTDNWYDLQYGSVLRYSEQQGSHIDAHRSACSG